MAHPLKHAQNSARKFGGKPEDYVRGYSRQLLLDGGVLARGGLKKMATFDDELITRNLSPGGSADLLAVTIFLANLPTGAQHA